MTKERADLRPEVPLTPTAIREQAAELLAVFGEDDGARLLMRCADRIEELESKGGPGDAPGSSWRHEPPTDLELTQWGALRARPSPGPETLTTVYRVAFPVLLDEVHRLRERLRR